MMGFGQQMVQYALIEATVAAQSLGILIFISVCPCDAMVLSAK
jgi:hypothetical protein